MADNESHIQLDYFYGIQSEMFSFLRIPKILIKDGRFEHLSNEAKMLFGLLLDKMSLSMKNRWFDDDDRVYIIYTNKNIMIDLGIETQKCVKLLKELENYGLIERKKQGLSKPDIIYVKNFATLVDDGNEQPKEMEKRLEEREKRRKARKEGRTNQISKDAGNADNSADLRKSQDKDCENHNSRNVKITGRGMRESQHEEYDNHNTENVKITDRELRKSQANNTDFSNTDISNTDYGDTDKNDTDISLMDKSSLTHSLSPESVADQNSFQKSGVSEGESEDIYSLIEKDMKCQEKMIAHAKYLQGFTKEELKEYRRSGIDDGYDLKTSLTHAEYLKKLTYRLFLDSIQKYRWNQIETIEMARQVLNVRLESRALKEVEKMDYYEDELLDTLINYMADIIGTGESITVNGARLTAEYMGLKFFELNRELILHVIQTLRSSYTEVRNKKNYYVSCLLNAKDHYVTEVYGDIKTI